MNTDSIYLQLVLGEVSENGDYEYSLRLHYHTEESKLFFENLTKQLGLNFLAVQNQSFMETTGLNVLKNTKIKQLNPYFLPI